RSIKPEFFEDEKLATSCSIIARHLFTGLWVYADDEGRMRASPAFLKSHVLPYDETISVKEVGSLLEQLVAGKFVVLYEVNGERFLWIRNFKKHQKIDKPSPSRLPPPPREFGESSTNVRRTLDEPSPNPRRLEVEVEVEKEME